MTHIRKALDFILESKLTQAEDILFEHVKDVMEHRLSEMQKIVASERFAEIREAADYDDEPELLDESNNYEDVNEAEHGASVPNGYEVKRAKGHDGYTVWHNKKHNVGATETLHTKDPHYSNSNQVRAHHDDGVSNHTTHGRAIQHIISQHRGVNESHKKNNVTKQGRLKLIRVRVRGGKVQRRKKVSAVKGFTVRGGHVTRMSAAERRHRRMGARKAKIKRRSKKAQIHRKLVKSLRKRKQMGI